MSSKDAHLYNPRPANLRHGKPISSNNSLSFTSSLSSLINNSSNGASRAHKPTSSRTKPKKDDIFRQPNRDSAKHAKLDVQPTTFQQHHTTDGENIERDVWERSQKKMEEKSRLYAAMKRGDVEDIDEKYTVDFDRKWAEKYDEGEGSEQDDEEDEEEEEMVEYTDEFGRARTGTKSEAARVKRIQNAQSDLSSDRFTARPSAPTNTNLIHGDTIQHSAFQPDAIIAEQMDELAKKRDASLTPPPEEHFDSRREVRSKGTGFFHFSGDAAERKRQMDELEKERSETERVRGKRKADEFLESLGEELDAKVAREDSQEEKGTR